MTLEELVSKPPIRPVLHYMLVRVEEVEETTQGGIVIPKDTRDSEQMGQGVGTVVAMGPTCFTHETHRLPNGEYPGACKIGDRVVYQRYAGVVPPIDGVDDGRLRLLRDEDVIGVIA